MNFNMCMKYKIIIYSILTGWFITLITGFFPNVFLSGVRYWGYLLPWSRAMAYSRALLDIMWVNFIVDIVIWSVLIYLALVSVEEKEIKLIERKPTRRSVRKPAKKRKR